LSHILKIFARLFLAEIDPNANFRAAISALAQTRQIPMRFFPQGCFFINSNEKKTDCEDDFYLEYTNFRVGIWPVFI